MNLSKSMLFPMGLALLVGACSPFYPKPTPPEPTAQTPTGTQTLTPEQQRLLDESRANSGGQTQGTQGQKTQNTNMTPSNVDSGGTPGGSVTPPPPVSKNYPTASPVSGKPGFVFNPYTHNIVDVKGIASGKLCRDPEDADTTHKFRVP